MKITILPNNNIPELKINKGVDLLEELYYSLQQEIIDHIYKEKPEEYRLATRNWPEFGDDLTPAELIEWMKQVCESEDETIDRASGGIRNI